MSLYSVVRKFSLPVGLAGFLIGLLSFAFSIWTYVERKDDVTIYFHVETRIVYWKAEFFDVSARHGNKQIGDEIKEVVVTFWSVGPGTVRGSDVRALMGVTFQSPENVYASQLLEYRSSVYQNFALEPCGCAEGINVSFKIFDPGMAVKLAILTGGRGDSISIHGDLGGKVRFAEFEASTWPLFVWVFALGIAAFFLVSIVLLAHYVLNRFFRVSRRARRIWYIGVAIVGLGLEGAAGPYVLDAFKKDAVVSPPLSGFYASDSKQAPIAAEPTSKKK